MFFCQHIPKTLYYRPDQINLPIFVFLYTWSQVFSVSSFGNAKHVAPKGNFIPHSLQHILADRHYSIPDPVFEFLC